MKYLQYFCTEKILYTLMRTKIDVRRAIKERFGTVKAFANYANMCAPNIIQNVINGNPSIKKLEELCEKMGCDVTDLFYPIDEVKDEKNTSGFDWGTEQSEAFGEAFQMKKPSTSYLAGPKSVAEDDTPTTVHTQSEGRADAGSMPLMQANPVFCPHCGKQVRIGVVLLPEV